MPQFSIPQQLLIGRLSSHRINIPTELSTCLLMDKSASTRANAHPLLRDRYCAGRDTDAKKSLVIYHLKFINYHLVLDLRFLILEVRSFLWSSRFKPKDPNSKSNDANDN